MYIYDRAHQLADDIKGSPEFQAYQKLKEELFADENTKNMLSDFRKLQFQAQALVMSGKEIDAELQDKIKKVGEVLSFNPKIGEFFAAEYKFNTLMQDIYKILGEFSDLWGDLLYE